MLTRYMSFLLAFFLVRLTGTSQNTWTLKKDKDSIKVYNRGDEQSKFKELKVEMDLKASLSDLAAVILDIGDYKDWSFNTRTSYVIKQVSPSELYFYSEIESPWPADNRDLTLHLVITQEPVGKTMKINIRTVTGLVPPKPNTVRVPMSDETWVVTRMDKTQIRIAYQLKLDPGGALPAWLINTFSVKGPFETFKHLREQVRQPRYRNAVVPFIVN
ncbi:MAG: START domain-containing protein [Puia sp.]|nr:START domain-containing protein [Puia sp.]